VRIPDFDEPRPDLAIVRGDPETYDDHHPGHRRRRGRPRSGRRSSAAPAAVKDRASVPSVLPCRMPLMVLWTHSSPAAARRTA
jgi:hypothetical protein